MKLMDFCSVLKKLCFILMIICPHALAVTHSVQYLYTVITPEIHFTAVGLLDAEQFVYYDTNTTKMIPKTEWMRKIDADYPDYFNNQTQRMQSDQENLKQLLDTVMKSFNHTGGVHTLQRKYGCELNDNNNDDDDNGTVRGYDQLCYNGEDLIKLDLKRGSWIAANDKDLTIKEKWESAGAEANIQKSYLEKECIEWIKRWRIKWMADCTHHCCTHGSCYSRCRTFLL
ncbi:H-2 class I histocompatibility antigen, K-D alpha chain-like isoform X2 [Clarias gariepinus]|uniref:H-2 class I histocompatibility antigen, K-D alpha chain-like isoform X2 n=1 Tax=Clarias gariepinus TaxID=13013 RepID=UPI00234DD0A3|nr:H-2 class I histocompatibility antigen, K-D alpha chain-like isoform X2 [Clarias gariepinus]XP_053336712.1 H-2 class I histocompatibility antigen, K-D alpha chain-like isoform X2 [Clarias gariepinus]